MTAVAMELGAGGPYAVITAAELGEVRQRAGIYPESVSLAALRPA
jgi:hypothetical protein